MKSNITGKQALISMLLPKKFGKPLLHLLLSGNIFLAQMQYPTGMLEAHLFLKVNGKGKNMKTRALFSKKFRKNCFDTAIGVLCPA